MVAKIRSNGDHSSNIVRISLIFHVGTREVLRGESKAFGNSYRLQNVRKENRHGEVLLEEENQHNKEDRLKGIQIKEKIYIMEGNYHKERVEMQRG